jgi:hypothetical protein
MADITPSPSFNDPDWVPGFENLTPVQRYDALNQSKWIEEKLRVYLSETDSDEIHLGDGYLQREAPDPNINWALLCKRKDGNTWIEFVYHLVGYEPYEKIWLSARASPVVFIRCVVTGFYEDFQRFEVDPGFETRILSDIDVRQDIGDIFTNVLLKTVQNPRLWDAVLEHVRKNEQHIVLPYPQQQYLASRYGEQKVIGPNDRVFLISLYRKQLRPVRSSVGWATREISLYHVISRSSSPRLVIWIHDRTQSPDDPMKAVMIADAWIYGPVDLMKNAILTQTLFTNARTPAPGLTAGGRWDTMYPFYVEHRERFLQRTNEAFAAIYT